jgi:hypothetical protein
LEQKTKLAFKQRELESEEARWMLYVAQGELPRRGDRPIAGQLCTHRLTQGIYGVVAALQNPPNTDM